MNHETGYLEISPSGIDIIDFIVLTFLYIERRRRKELTKSVTAAASRARNSYSGTGAGRPTGFYQPPRFSGEAAGAVRNQRRVHRGFWGGGGGGGDVYGGDDDNHIEGYDYRDHHGWGHGHDHDSGGFSNGGDFGWGNASGAFSGDGGGASGGGGAD